MDWQAIGAIGEIVGAIAVVVTLGYLAHETRTNTRAVVASSVRASSQSFAEFNALIASDPDLARICMKGLQNPMADWDDLDWFRFGMFARSEANRLYDVFQQWQLGFYQDREAEWLIDFLPGFLEYPAWRTWWDDETKEGSRTYGPEFVRYVNSRKAPLIGMSKLGDIARADSNQRATSSGEAQP